MDWIRGNDYNVFQNIRSKTEKTKISVLSNLISAIKQEFNKEVSEGDLVETLIQDDITEMKTLTSHWMQYTVFFPAWGAMNTVYNVIVKDIEETEEPDTTDADGENKEDAGEDFLTSDYYESRERWMYFAVILYLQRERASDCLHLKEDCKLRKRLLDGVEEMREYFYSENSILEGIPEEMYEEINQVFGEESNWCPEFDEDSARYEEILKPYYLFKFMENNEKFIELYSWVSIESKLFLLTNDEGPVYEINPDSELQRFYEVCKRTKNATRLLTGDMKEVFEEFHKIAPTHEILSYKHHNIFGCDDMADIYKELTYLLKGFDESISEKQKKYITPLLDRLLQMNDYYIAKMIIQKLPVLFFGDSNLGLSSYLHARYELEYRVLPNFLDILEDSGNVQGPLKSREDIVVRKYGLKEVMDKLENWPNKG